MAADRPHCMHPHFLFIQPRFEADEFRLSPRKPDSPQLPTANKQQIVQSHRRKVNSVISLIGRGAGHLVLLLRICASGLEANGAGIQFCL